MTKACQGLLSIHFHVLTCLQFDRNIILKRPAASIEWEVGNQSPDVIRAIAKAKQAPKASGAPKAHAISKGAPKPKCRPKAHASGAAKARAKGAPKVKGVMKFGMKSSLAKAKAKAQPGDAGHKVRKSGGPARNLQKAQYLMRQRKNLSLIHI